MRVERLMVRAWQVGERDIGNIRDFGNHASAGFEGAPASGYGEQH